MFNRGYLRIKGDVSFREGFSATNVRSRLSCAIPVSRDRAGGAEYPSSL